MTPQRSSRLQAVSGFPISHSSPVPVSSSISRNGMRTRRKFVLGLIAAAVLLALGGVSLRSTLGRLQKVGADIPVTRVRRGDLDLRVFSTGELRATRTVALVAPSVAGGTLQII